MTMKVAVTCNKTADLTETISINSNDETNYWLTAVALKAILCLLLLVVIVVKY